MDRLEPLVRQTLADPPIAVPPCPDDFGDLRRRMRSYRRRRRLLTGAVAVAVVGVVGAGTFALTPLTTLPVATPAGLPAVVQPPDLDLWRAFPVTRAPRPLVLLDELPIVTGKPDGQFMKAVTARGYEMSADVPASRPADRAVALPDGTATLGLTTVSETLKAMGAPPPAPNDDRNGPALTAVDLIDLPFRTDRGPVTLPAWSFTAGPGVTLVWPAVTPAATWRLGDLRGAADTEATVSTDGRQLELTLPEPPAPCDGSPMPHTEVVADESSTTVAVSIHIGPPSPPAGNCRRLAFGRRVTYDVQLRAPLGARVLVNAEAAPIAVTPRP